MRSFSHHDLKKHLYIFNDLKYQAYISNEVFYILGNFCTTIYPVYKKLIQQDNLPCSDIIIQQFYNLYVKIKENKIYLYDNERPKALPIHTSPGMIVRLCAGVGSILEDEKLSRRKTTATQKKYIHKVLPYILPEIYNGTIVRFNQLIEATRKTLINVVAQDQSDKTGLKITFIQEKLKQNKVAIFQYAEQMGLIPSANVLTQYQQARDIIFAHPGIYPTNDLSLSNAYTYTNKKGEIIHFNPNYFGISNVLENYEKMLAMMLNIPQDEVSHYLPDNTSLNTNTIEAGICIDCLEGNRQLRKKIMNPLPTSQNKEKRKDTLLRNRLEHAQETPTTLEHLKERESVLFNKNKKLTLNWFYELLSHQRDS